MKQPKKALADYSQAIKLDPTNFEPFQGRAEIYYRSGQYQKSLADITRAIQLHPDVGDLYVNRAQTYEKLRKPDLARKDLETARKNGYRR